jgi:DNA-binding ferritin-like protein
MSLKEMQDEIAERAKTISDTSNMSMFDSSMSRQEISEHMQSIIDSNIVKMPLLGDGNE